MTKRDFQNLVRKVRQCRECAAHLPHAPRPVLQVSETARLLIAGQAPGRRVHLSGRPFDDASGVRLREWLGMNEVAFYDASLVAILPMGFCFPGTGGNGDLPPRPECAPLWRARLLSGMRSVRLTIVIGRFAADWHLSRSVRATLTETVRAWREFGRSVVPIPHPSPRNNRWLRHNPWFLREVVPELRIRIRDALGVLNEP